MSEDYTNAMKQAWEFYHQNNIQQTCKLLLEIGKECREKKVSLPDDHAELTHLCMLQDMMELELKKHA
ncbi:MAG: hypothetical protein ACOY3I_04080 [Verrucomicrobiota bacterium]